MRRRITTVKVGGQPADVVSMFVLIVMTVSYFGAVLWLLQSRRRRAGIVAPCLPEDDQPPGTAVGWPPEGTRFTQYVDEGFAALDAYLAGATPPEVG